MQETGWTPQRARMGGIARAIVGLVLFILVLGIWACLWVPPGPTF